MEDLSLFLDILVKFFDFFFNFEIPYSGVSLGYLIIIPIIFKIFMRNVFPVARSVGSSFQSSSGKNSNVKEKGEK